MISGETPHASLLNNATKVNSLRNVFDRFFKNGQARMLEANHTYFIRHISLINAFDSFFVSVFFKRALECWRNGYMGDSLQIE